MGAKKRKISKIKECILGENEKLEKRKCVYLRVNTFIGRKTIKSENNK